VEAVAVDFPELSPGDQTRGMDGGNDGKCGSNLLRRIDGTTIELPGRCTFSTFNALKGERLVINTPGGGGWGQKK